MRTKTHQQDQDQREVVVPIPPRGRAAVTSSRDMDDAIARRSDMITPPDASTRLFR